MGKTEFCSCGEAPTVEMLRRVTDRPFRSLWWCKECDVPFFLCVRPMHTLMQRVGGKLIRLRSLDNKGDRP